MLQILLGEDSPIPIFIYLLIRRRDLRRVSSMCPLTAALGITHVIDYLKTHTFCDIPFLVTPYLKCKS